MEGTSSLNSWRKKPRARDQAGGYIARRKAGSPHENQQRTFPHSLSKFPVWLRLLGRTYSFSESHGLILAIDIFVDISVRLILPHTTWPALLIFDRPLCLLLLSSPFFHSR